MTSNEEVQKQRQYYTETASHYDAMQIAAQDEHQFALALLSAFIEYHGIKSVLDVGSGTGRALRYLKARHPDVRFVGVEPVAALRQVGYAAGLTADDLRDGDVNALGFKAGEFDLVCEFAVLHHVPHPAQAVAEMLRVSRTAIFISDANNFGQGSWLSRTLKQGINALGLWSIFNYLRTGGRRYSISDGAGLFYSYSVFNNYHQIDRACKAVHLINTVPAGVSLYRSAPHVALFALKQ